MPYEEDKIIKDEDFEEIERALTSYQISLMDDEEKNKIIDDILAKLLKEIKCTHQNQ